MAQYKKTVFDLSKGPGLAIPDPRQDEARAREAMALQRLALAQQQIEAMDRNSLAAAQLGQQGSQFLAELQQRASLAAMDRAMQERLAGQQAQGFAEERASRERMQAQELNWRSGQAGLDRRMQASLANAGFANDALGRQVTMRGQDMDQAYRRDAMDLDAIFKTAGLGLDEDRLNFARTQHSDDVALRRRGQDQEYLLGMAQLNARGGGKFDAEKDAYRVKRIQQEIATLSSTPPSEWNLLKRYQELNAEDPEIANRFLAYVQSEEFQKDALHRADPSERNLREADEEQTLFKSLFGIQGPLDTLYGYVQAARGLWNMSDVNRLTRDFNALNKTPRTAAADMDRAQGQVMQAGRPAAFSLPGMPNVPAAPSAVPPLSPAEVFSRATQGSPATRTPGIPPELVEQILIEAARSNPAIMKLLMDNADRKMQALRNTRR